MNNTVDKTMFSKEHRRECRIEYFKRAGYKEHIEGSGVWQKPIEMDDETIGWYVELYEDLDQYRCGNYYKWFPECGGFCAFEVITLTDLIKKARKEYENMKTFVKRKCAIDAAGLDYDAVVKKVLEMKAKEKK